MVERDYFRGLSPEEKARYKFEFCRNCPLYECELIQEYEQFRANHPKDAKPLEMLPVWDRSSDTLIIQGTSFMTSPGDIVAFHGISVPALQGDFGSPKTDPTYCADGSDPDTDFPSYDKEELKNGCIMSSRHVCPIECGRERVAEGIGDHFKIETDYESNIRTGVTDRWEPLQPVFISAQTGQGKNYFIENTLIPYVRELNYKNCTNQKVLILSNRLALKNQMKDRLNGDNSDDFDDKLDPIYHFGEFADVISYQSVLQREKILEDRQKKAKDRYIYVICDEAHFFTSDAMFNPHTANILSTIVKVFQNAIRVYMSATPYECLKYIIEYEQKYQDVLNSGKIQGKYRISQMVFYHFQRDYSYLDVKSYSSIDELFEIIVDSVNKRKEKWLIFIDDKEHGSWVKDKLLECERLRLGCSQILNGGDQYAEEDESKAKEQILVVKAESKSNKTYMAIIKKERLGKNTHVLISTSVLDNGVNLEDIDNIVVSDISKTKCLQMVGRARVSGPNDRKTLYIKRFGGYEVDKRIRNFDRQKSAYHSYNLAYGESHNLTQPRGNSEWRFLKKYYDGSVRDWGDAKHWFGRARKDPQKLCILIR